MGASDSNKPPARVIVHSQHGIEKDALPHLNDGGGQVVSRYDTKTNMSAGEIDRLKASGHCVETLEVYE